MAHLPLHWGRAPKWLFSRMSKLAREITIAIIEEYGPEEMLVRLSDPYWFQAFGCILGYDWHSSGVTTTVCGALKHGLHGLEKELHFFVAGGKGGTSRKTPREILSWGERGQLKINPEKLIYASKMSAKVDSTAIQDGYQLYHHNFFFTTNGSWAVVQQGMPHSPSTPRKKNRLYYLKDLRAGNSSIRKTQFARRYHWISKKVKSFTNEPQSGICDDMKYKQVLNLTATKSKNARNVITLIAKENPDKLLKEYQKIITLSMPKREWVEYSDIKPQNLYKVMTSTYERQPNTFEELLGMKGLGPKSLRALTLISEIAYGTKADWQDPVKYSFAHGGKDGYPYPVDRATYDKSIETLKQAIQKAKIESVEKSTMLKNLFK
jgi:hypothetical protein